MNTELRMRPVDIMNRKCERKGWRGISLNNGEEERHERKISWGTNAQKPQRCWILEMVLVGRPLTKQTCYTFGEMKSDANNFMHQMEKSVTCNI